MRNGSSFLTRYDDLVAVYKNTRIFSSDKKREFAPKYGDSLLYEHHTTESGFQRPTRPYPGSPADHGRAVAPRHQ